MYYKIKGFVIWIICALFFLYEFFIRTVIGTYQFQLMHDLNLSSFQFSLLSTTLFLLIYGLMQIPAGLIVDNIGLKKSLLIASTCCMISSVTFAYSYHYTVAIISRMMMGFGASFGFICLLISVYEWLPRKYTAVFIGLSQFIGTLGPMMAAGPLDSISSNMSWRFIFLCLGVIGFVIAILVYYIVENNKQHKGEYTLLYKPEKITTALIRLFSRIQPLYIALLSTSLYFAIEYLSENEGRAFLALKNISLNSASYMITIAWFGHSIGAPLVGYISDVIQRRKLVLQCCSFTILIATLMILYLSNKILLQLGFLLLGLGSSGQSIGFATISEQFKKQFIAVGFGLNNAFITTISAINAPMIGLFLDHVSKGNKASLNDYLIAFSVLVIFAVLGCIISSFYIKETYCKSAVDFTILKRQNY